MRPIYQVFPRLSGIYCDFFFLKSLHRHNGAQFDVATTRRLGYEVLERIIKPCCLHIGKQAERKGLALNGDVVVVNQCAIINVMVPLGILKHF